MVKCGHWQVVMGGNGKCWQVLASKWQVSVDKVIKWQVALWIKMDDFFKWLIGIEYDLMARMWLGVSRGGFMVKMWYGINGLAMLSTSGVAVVVEVDDIPKNSAECGNDEIAGDVT